MPASGAVSMPASGGHTLGGGQKKPQEGQFKHSENQFINFLFIIAEQVPFLSEPSLFFAPLKPLLTPQPTIHVIRIVQGQVTSYIWLRYWYLVKSDLSLSIRYQNNTARFIWTGCS